MTTRDALDLTRRGRLHVSARGSLSFPCQKTLDDLLRDKPGALEVNEYKGSIRQREAVAE
jgi:hypothetical protein